MEIYDIVMIVVLVGAMIFGAIKGFAWQLASIASIVISYTVAFKYREPFSQSIQAEPPWNRFLAMLILFIGTSLVIWVVFRMISGSIDRLKLREFDRQVGAMFGLAKGALYCILITLFGVTLMGDGVRVKIVQSKSGNYIADVLQRSDAVIPAEIQGVVQPYLERFDQEFHQSEDPGGSFQSPWTAGDSLGKPRVGIPVGMPSREPWGLDSTLANRGCHFRLNSHGQTSRFRGSARGQLLAPAAVRGTCLNRPNSHRGMGCKDRHADRLLVGTLRGSTLIHLSRSSRQESTSDPRSQERFESASKPEAWAMAFGRSAE